LEGNDIFDKKLNCSDNFNRFALKNIRLPYHFLASYITIGYKSRTSKSKTGTGIEIQGERSAISEKKCAGKKFVYRLRRLRGYLSLSGHVS